MLAILALLLGVTYSQETEKWRGIKREYLMEDLLSEDVNTLKIFHQWADAFDRDYIGDIEVEAKKYAVFLDNLWEIGETNSKHLTYRLGLNQFSDMTQEEYLDYIHGGSDGCARDGMDNGNMKLIGRDNDWIDAQLPSGASSIDWSQKGVVTPVKNQGQCGSCWTFSATGVLECDYAIKTGTLRSLSEQQIVDCCHIGGSAGCNGGFMWAAVQYAQQSGGLCTEDEYPYTARDGSCQASSCGQKYDAPSGYTNVPESENGMESALQKGCVSIGVDAAGAFMQYSGGVLTGYCGTSIDHGVLMVGMGGSYGTPYYKVKNSWGASWGESGYIRLGRGSQYGSAGQCGCQSTAIVPTF